ncbi:ribosome biogenesis GTP-binding protein YihA/YsxC [Humitalea sp. 24SJ18S-53]|uniref:ribosome biogenesis GTP-binding protein YihA/YsxC n=1 Tax=Humitalea sp. 24SJ18S-53 TaxID=3422307 RepID=UPI003D6665BE
MNPREEPKPEKPKPPPKSTPSDPIAAGPAEPEARAAWLDAGRLLFARPCTFFYAAQRIDQLPEPKGAEVAFCGRSNVGKSSLINALTGHNALARVSRTPGRTRQLNFFDLAEGRLTLVDMPGYGYAEAAKSIKEDWQGLMFDFLRGRPTLKRLILLIDARIEIKPVDYQVMDLLAQAAVAFHLVLTKADSVPAAKLREKEREVSGLVKIRAAALPSIITTSSQTGLGIPELRAEIATLAD